MTKLSVNINKIATIRNARGGQLPNVTLAAQRCEAFGADGITVHPRPDGRHITYTDVREIAKIVTTEFNIEGFPSNDFIQLIHEVKPHQVTLVPDPPDAITSNAGWDTIKHHDFLLDILKEFKQAGIRTSLFLDTNLKYIESAAHLQCDRIELYTENYAVLFPKNKKDSIQPYIDAAQLAHQLGFGLNAGHDLNLHNLSYFKKHIPFLEEVSIGHALISDALYLGLEETIRQYKQCLR
ncbi:MAG: pyridoxine 5'-phosphate synthase [Flavobacteriales bacterium]